jgi:GTP:adenosylcobinamide-phosphate guanylyltransferase
MGFATPQWTAIVLAGQRPGEDPLASHFGETFKARVRLGGETMLARVLRALTQTPEVARIVVLAQDDAVLAGIDRDERIRFVTSGAGISASIAALAGEADAPWPVLVTTADHPLLTPEIISHFLAESTACDLAVGVVERHTLETAYPGNRRTWLRFSDGAWTGANLFALNGAAARAALEFWSRAEQDRKTAWRLFLHFGPWLCLRALTRTIGLTRGLAQAGARLGLSARLIALPFAEAAIDVDKPSDHDLAEQILAKR